MRGWVGEGGWREELVEKGIQNARAGYVYIEREGLRGNEGAYCVEKETENGREEGTLHATPTH